MVFLQKKATDENNRLNNNMSEDKNMFGPFDDMFDFNRDGKLDSWERGAEFHFLDEMEKEENSGSYDWDSDNEEDDDE